MKFYNREQEINELRRIEKLSFTRHSRMTVLTGRRRIGKTSLVKKAFGDSSENPMLYFFTARKTESALVDDFIREIHNKIKVYVPEGLRTMSALMRHLFELAKTINFNLVIDEFQEFRHFQPLSLY